MSRKHPGRFHIAIPGPTNIPERILNAMHISSEDQRNPEIPNLTIPLLVILILDDKIGLYHPAS